MASCDLICVDPARASEFWPHVYAHLKRAVEQCGDVTLSELHDSVLARNGLLWIAWDGTTVLSAAVTKLVATPHGLVCAIVACGGGHLDRWVEHFAGIEAYARAEGCTRVRLQGRPGWGKALHMLPKWSMFEREL